MAMAVLCPSTTPCVSAHFLTCRRDGDRAGDGDGWRRLRASPRRVEEIPRRPHRQSRASVEIQLVENGLHQFCHSSSSLVPTTRVVENQLVGGKCLVRFGNSSLSFVQSRASVESQLAVKKRPFRFGYSVKSFVQSIAAGNQLVGEKFFRLSVSSLNFAPTRAVGNQLLKKGSFRLGYSRLNLAYLNQIGVDWDGRRKLTARCRRKMGLFPFGYSDLTSGFFNQIGVDVEENEVSGRYSREGRVVTPRAAASDAVTVSHQEKGRKEKDVVKLPNSVDYISSPSNPYVKHLVRLRQNPKSRTATESVLVIGTIPLREICDSMAMADRKVPTLVDVLLVNEDTETPDELAKVSRRVVRVSADAMSKLSGLDSPPQVAGVLRFPPTFMAMEQVLNSSAFLVKMRKWLRSPRRILVLDSIQDPGNLGTLLRTAAAFAWDGVFLLHGCCDPFNDKALRASRGASFRVPIGVGEWEHVREFAIANELKLFAGDPEPVEKGSSASGNMEDEFKVSVEGGQGLCLVLGSEGQGLSEDVTRDCVPIGIPMPGNFESLNVAVAGGILMFLLR
ncbi:unnamed protein product [Calypogeia fissa]